MERFGGKKSQIGLVLAGVAFGIALGVGIERAATAQQSGIKRTPLVTVDEPGAVGHEAIMGLAELAPGASSGRHFHHGVEIGYVLDGSIIVEQQGRPAQTLKSGEVFRIDPSAPHEAKNQGSTVAKLLTVHMVEKGKPLAEPVK